MSDLKNKIAETIAKCGRELKHPALFPVAEKLRAQGNYEHQLQAVLASTNREQALLALAARPGAALEPAEDRDFVLPRVLLAEVALQNLRRLESLPLETSVKSMFCDYCQFFVTPNPREMRLFQPNQYSFLALAKIALMERFPGGQFDWEISGFPRSWLLKIPFAALPRVAYFLARRLGGFAPCIVPHMGFRRKNPLMLVQRECEKSWYRMAISAEQQPHIRGLVACAWFFSPDAFKVSPHLAFLVKPFVETGGLTTTRGIAAPNEGFLAGSEARRKLYESGEFKPTMGLILWTREQMIRWAHSHSELSEA